MIRSSKWGLFMGIMIAAALLAACGGSSSTPTESPTVTAVPSATASPPPSETPIPEPTATAEATPTPAETPIQVTIEPVTGERVPPPIDITLPDGWLAGYDVAVLQDFDGLRLYPVAVYLGPVTGGTGNIVLVWGFANLVRGNPLTGGAASQVNLWSDGLRLWRLLLTEVGCNVGTDVQREFLIGEQRATGTFISAVDCPEEADIRGWFAGVQMDGLNFIFYMYGEPEVMDGPASEELQAILNSVRFRVEDFLQSAPTATP